MSSRLALVALLAALAPVPLAFRAAGGSPVARVVPLDARDPARRDVGRLHYLGGWRLTGRDRRFGGISSMTIEDGAFTLLSDTGVVTRLRLARDGTVTDYAIHALPNGPGAAWRKINRDSESSTYDPASGHVWAGFETRNEIWRYTKGFAAADGHVAPAAMAGWPDNEGAEAMVRLRDGRFLVFAETKQRPDHGGHLVLMFPGDPVAGAVPFEFGFHGPYGYAPTDAAELPDGRVIVLMRRFSPGRGLLAGALGFSGALIVIDPREARPDGTVAVDQVAEFAPPLTVDNMEALAVERRDGRTILWIASDDNFFVLQRTLLLAFALDGDVRRRVPDRTASRAAP
ncbi:esterase-like activity of phytase family protein [Sphingomonas sp.]|uniref:esterase-like activity of phytase family protein n=1 Tax=Sphingomonas sp. TaxID=28214 RepID=UPI003AFF9A64